MGAGAVVVERDSRYDRQQPVLIRHGEASPNVYLNISNF